MKKIIISLLCCLANIAVMAQTYLIDLSGQGSAYVGILDAFMDSKGITTPEEWRQWCAPS